MENFALAWPQDTYEHYSSGHCMHLAAAFHRKLGWEIQLTMQPAEGHHSPYVEHAWVVDPSGTYCLDADGIYPLEKNGFIGAWNPIHTGLVEVELKEFTRLGSSQFTDERWEASIQKALEVAEAHFPLDKIVSLLGHSKVAEALAVSEELPFAALPVLYHGTTKRQWRTRHGDSSYLNLTSNLQDARNYADEWAESEIDDYGNCHPMVVQISPTALVKMLQKPGVTLEPDWGWVEGQEHDAKRNGGAFAEGDATWQNSLEKCSGLGISGFQDKFKKAFWNVDETTLQLG